MSLLRLLQRIHRSRRLAGAGRMAAATLLLAAGLFQPGTAPAVLAAPILAAPAPLAPQACTPVVSNTHDSGAGSLREAVTCPPSNRTITFAFGLAHSTILLTSGAIPLTQSLTINGSGAPGVKVDAGDNSRVFNITASGTVTLTALVLQHGRAASGNGGAVLAGAGSPLVLSKMQVLSSTASVGLGGGLYAGGTLTLTSTDFISNTSAAGGGGGYAQQAAVLTKGLFQGNQCTGAACGGGGLFADGTLTLTSTDFISNTSAGYGGGATAESAAVVTNSRFQGNHCTGSGCDGGGLYAGGTLTLTGTDFISNTSTLYGGGAFAYSAAVVTNGRFQGNHCTGAACFGGGLFANTTLTLTGTDFLSNTSGYPGGGAFAGGAAVLMNGRFQGNQCSGIYCDGGGLYAGGTLTLTGTDFISNTSGYAGGGAYAQGAAVLTNGLFQGNQCTSSYCLGGGLLANTTLTLTGTQFISNTTLSGAGGGAWAWGAAVLTNGLFQDNHCTAAGCVGGGLGTDGTLTVTGTQFISNTSGYAGGAFALGAVSLTNGLFQGNQSTQAGGGLDTFGTLTLTGTDFINNTSIGYGGGAYAQDAAVLTNGLFQDNHCTGTGCEGGGLYAIIALTLTSTDFISNTSLYRGGGAYAQGAAVLSNGEFQGNQCTGSGCLGGGLFANDTALVLGSSFSANQSVGWGGGVGLTATAQITLANVTLSSNLASVSGGGLYAGGASQASLWNVTVADNQAPSGGGVLAQAGATLVVANTLFSNNSGGNCAGPIAAGTHNLEWPGAACATAGPLAAFSTANPLLAPLALNAPGATLTRALLNTSPARDAGDEAVCAAPPVNNVDQRGVVRPIRGLPGPGLAICDIGAFEAGPPVWQLFLPLVRR